MTQDERNQRAEAPDTTQEERNQRAEADLDTKAFEAALTAAPPERNYCLRLFVSGSTPRSGRAIQNIRALCKEKLHGHYELEVIDIYQHPEEVKPEQIIVTPTLVRKLPLPIRKIIGDLSDKDRVLVALDLVAVNPFVEPPEDKHEL
jgi:circadian clock protein KaiB